jgi:hypothetical protein
MTSVPHRTSLRTSLLSLTAPELINSHADNGQDGNVLGDKERLLPTTLNLSKTDSSKATSVTHQLLPIGNNKLQDASTSPMLNLAP